MILQRRPKSPEHYVITIGSPWLINGEPSEATTATEALAEIYERATWFPAWVDVNTTDGSTYYLQMDAEGATETREAPSEDEGPAMIPLTEEILEPAPVEVHETPSKAPAAASRAEDVDENEPAADENEGEGEAESSRRRLSTPVKIGAAGVVLALLVGVGAVAAHSVGSGTDDPAPAAEQSTAAPSQTPAALLPEDATALAVTPRAVIALEGDQLLWLDPNKGTQVADPVAVKNPEQTRAMSTKSLDVVADGSDQYVTYDGKKAPEAHQGSANLRGETPVVTEGGKVRALGESQDAKAVPDKAAVFNGVTGGVAFARAPKSVIYPDHRVTLQGPKAQASIAKWVQADTDRVVVVWKSGNTKILASHDPKTGKITDKSELGEKDEVNVIAGVVRVGSPKYLNGGSLTTICAGGEFVPGGLICPTDGDRWKTPAGATAAEKPAAIGSTKYVTTTNEIKNLEK